MIPKCKPNDLLYYMYQISPTLYLLISFISILLITCGVYWLLSTCYPLRTELIKRYSSPRNS